MIVTLTAVVRVSIRDEIQVPACAARVQKIMEYASSDIRFDVPLAEACFEDRQEFCGSVPPGSARVIRCLQDRCARARFILDLQLYHLACTLLSAPHNALHAPSPMDPW